MIPPKRNSASRLETFAGICERRYFWDCFEPREENAALAKGLQIHKMLEAAGRDGYPALAPAAAGPLKTEALLDYYTRARPVLDLLKPTGIELWFEDQPAPGFCGKIDLISSTSPRFSQDGLPVAADNAPCVLDWKTVGLRNSGKNDYEARRSIQLQLYALVTGIPRAGFVYLPEAGAVHGVIIEFSQDELREARRWFEAQAAVIAARWEHTEGPDDPSQFALADRLGRNGFLCAPKWCRFFSKCLGKTVDNQPERA